MNQKTAKHLRAYLLATAPEGVTHRSYRKSQKQIKRHYQSLPWNKRHAFKKHLTEKAGA